MLGAAYRQHFRGLGEEFEVQSGSCPGSVRSAIPLFSSSMAFSSLCHLSLILVTIAMEAVRVGLKINAIKIKILSLIGPRDCLICINGKNIQVDDQLFLPTVEPNLISTH